MTATAQKPIPYNPQWIEEDDIEAVSKALTGAFLTQGPLNNELGKAVADYVGAKHAHTVSSGTAALHTAVSALGVGPGSIGIVPAMTFAATANCLLYCNADVRFADVDPVTGLIDLEHLNSLLNELKDTCKKPGVIMPVSLRGDIPDLPAIQVLAKEVGWKTVEDGAQSLGGEYTHDGAVYKSTSCAHTDMATLSFHALKHICTGEGGAVVTNDDALSAKAGRFRTHGIQRPYTEEGNPDKPLWYNEQVDLGYNYRMTEIQAALGISQLKKLPRFLKTIHQRAAHYREVLSQKPFSECFSLIPHTQGEAHHLFVLHFKTEKMRNEAFCFLREHKI